MANTGSLQVRNDLGAMRLTITADFDVDNITRTDANGTQPVRLREGALPLPAAGPAVIDDYEAAAGPISYTMSGTAPGAPAGPRQAFTRSGLMTLETAWLGVPIMQSYAQPLDSVLNYDANVPGRSTVHEPPGRRDPIVVLRKMGTRRGSMELWAGAYERTGEILAALSRGEVLMLRQGEHSGQDMYFVAADASISALDPAEDETQFSVSISYVEVRRPTGFIASAPGWDFSQMAAAHTSFQDIAVRYSNFQNLSLNEAS